MPKKKNPDETKPKVTNPNVMGLRAEVLEQPITETLEINYMPIRALSFRWASSARLWDASTAPSGPKQPAFWRKYPQ